MSALRITPSRAPFRRAGLFFPTREPVLLPLDSLTEVQQRQLAGDAAFLVELSADDGATWTPFLLPAAPAP